MGLAQFNKILTYFFTDDHILCNLINCTAVTQNCAQEKNLLLWDFLKNWNITSYYTCHLFNNLFHQQRNRPTV